MENKQTAVEWLVEQVNLDCLNSVFIKPDLVKQAKEMEKEQISNAQMDMFNNINQNKFGLDYLNKRDAAEEYAERYYNETYKTPKP